MNIKLLLMSTALLAATVNAAPAAPPTKCCPSGRLLLQDYTAPVISPGVSQETDSDEKQGERLLDSGEYYVLLPDGRLQMVKYTTAALRESDQELQQFQQTQQIQQPQQQQQQQSQQTQKLQQPQQPQQQPQFQYSQQFQQFQQIQQFQQPQQFQQAQQSQKQQAEPQPQLQYVQFPLPGSQYTQTKLEYKTPEAEQEAENLEEETAIVNGFKANVQFREVQPITAPIYAYNPTPLVRILKR